MYLRVPCSTHYFLGVFSKNRNFPARVSTRKKKLQKQLLHVNCLYTQEVRKFQLYIYHTVLLKGKDFHPFRVTLSSMTSHSIPHTCKCNYCKGNVCIEYVTLLQTTNFQYHLIAVFEEVIILLSFKSVDMNETIPKQIIVVHGV